MKKYLIYWTCLVFLLCLGIGFFLAGNFPLWNDEIYTQISSVSGHSYGDMLLGRIAEGNNSPLFYMIQKSICHFSGYTTPQVWIDGRWGVRDGTSEILLRINPVLFMSLSVFMIFYFFSHFYSMPVGVYSLSVTLSSYMVWAFWAQARPYALWVCLTTCQSLIFLYLIQGNKPSDRIWKGLIAAHFLLAFTAVFSLAQIVIISFLLWVIFERNFKKYILLTVIPCIICLFFYIKAAKYDFWFKDTPLDLINANIPKDRLLIFAVFIVTLLLYYFRKRLGAEKLFANELITKGAPYAVFVFLMLTASSLILLIFTLGDSRGESGFQVSNRYFIYLTPIGVIATTLFSVYLIKAFQGRLWLQSIMIAMLGGLLAIRGWRTFALVCSFYQF